jgi:hypothetical protein
LIAHHRPDDSQHHQQAIGDFRFERLNPDPRVNPEAAGAECGPQRLSVASPIDLMQN